MPHGAATPLRPGVKETARPHSQEWRLLCCTPSPTLAIFGPLGAVWCVNSARVIATVIHSCRSHERSRRCRRLIAAPVALPTPSMVDNLKAQQKITNTNGATCLSLEWCWWCRRGIQEAVNHRKGSLERIGDRATAKKPVLRETHRRRHSEGTSGENPKEPQQTSRW